MNLSARAAAAKPSQESKPRSPAVRAALGVGQMFGALAGLTALVRFGITWVTVGIIIGTSALTVTSRVLFPRKPADRPR